MRISNPDNLPGAYVRAVSEQRIPMAGRISVTELLQPPQKRALQLQFFDRIEAEAGSRIDLFFGNAVHEYLARFAGADALAEERLEWIDPESMIIVHGTPDSAEWLGVDDAGVLIDWKTTKVRALKYDKPEWASQVNLYAHLLALNGLPVRSLVVWAFLKDWDRQQRGDPEYPRQPLVKIPVPMWNSQQAHQFLMQRLQLHRAAARGFYQPCTDEERWKRDTYALMKDGNQNATRVFDSAAAAEEYAEAVTEKPRAWRDWYEVEQRRGRPLRCESYCESSPFCQQWKEDRQARQQSNIFDALQEAPLLRAVPSDSAQRAAQALEQ